MSLQLPNSTFWRRWLVVGLVAGSIAGILLLVIWAAIYLFQPSFPDLSNLFLRNAGQRGEETAVQPTLPSVRFMFSFLVLGGVYGFCQSLVPWLVLREQTPKLRRSLQAHFVATLIGTIVVGALLVWLMAAGLASFFSSLGLSRWQILVLLVFIVGGFGGIAQAIVQRFLLNGTTPASYLQWIAPLALLGHISGGIVGLIAMPLIL